MAACIRIRSIELAGISGRALECRDASAERPLWSAQYKRTQYPMDERIIIDRIGKVRILRCDREIKHQYFVAVTHIDLLCILVELKYIEKFVSIILSHAY